MTVVGVEGKAQHRNRRPAAACPRRASRPAKPLAFKQVALPVVGGEIDLITAGFPCQDASVANATGKGADGERTGLFREALRISREMGRTPLLLENVPKPARPFAKTNAASLQNDLEEYRFRQNGHCRKNDRRVWLPPGLRRPAGSALRQSRSSAKQDRKDDRPTGHPAKRNPAIPRGS